jgi:hypothetical protein
MGTQVPVVVNAGAATNAPAATTTAAPKVSWLKKVGLAIGKILHIVATDAKPIEEIAVPVAKAIAPQFSGLIDESDKIFSSIVNESIAAEGVATALGQGGTGPQKLQTVVTSIGPALDAWVQANFPGAAAVSDVEKAGLVNAVVAIINKVQTAAPAAT